MPPVPDHRGDAGVDAAAGARLLSAVGPAERRVEPGGERSDALRDIGAGMREQSLKRRGGLVDRAARDDTATPPALALPRRPARGVRRARTIAIRCARSSVQRFGRGRALARQHRRAGAERSARFIHRRVGGIGGGGAVEPVGGRDGVAAGQGDHSAGVERDLPARVDLERRALEQARDCAR